MSKIHATAIVHPRAQIDDSVHIGAYAVIGEHVQIAAGCDIAHHVSIQGHTTIGENNRIFPFAALGGAPQDKKYREEATKLAIGARNTIREFVTFNTGTIQDQGITQIGDDNWIMAYVHLAHDCILGNNNILANNASLAGHVTVENHVFLGGFTTVHQFCAIGSHAMAAFNSAVSQDIPPCVLAAGNRATAVGINTEGLKRYGFDSQHILAMKRAYKTLYRANLSLDAALEALSQQEESAPTPAIAGALQHFIDFVRSSMARRGILRP